MLDFAQLVQERNEWVAYNFPDSNDPDVPAKHSILGCIEEVGELAHAHLKEDQKIRGTAEEHQANAKDAIGDYTVYLFGVCAAYNAIPVDVPGLAQGMDPFRIIGVVTALTGQMMNKAFRDPNTPLQPMIALTTQAVAYLIGYCEARGWDYDAIVQGTWDAVKERDWIRYPDTGRPDGADTGLEDDGLARAAETDITWGG